MYGVLFGGGVAVAQIPVPSNKIAVGAVAGIGEVGTVVDTGVFIGKVCRGSIVHINGIGGTIFTTVDAGYRQGYHISTRLAVSIAGVLLYGAAAVTEIPIPGVDVGAHACEVCRLTETDAVVLYAYGYIGQRVNGNILFGGIGTTQRIADYQRGGIGTRFGIDVGGVL